MLHPSDISLASNPQIKKIIIKIIRNIENLYLEEANRSNK